MSKVHPLTEAVAAKLMARVNAPEAAIYEAANEAIRAVLTFEPTENAVCHGDDEIVSALNEIPPDPKFTKGMPAERCYRAMTAALLKEVEGE
jgi:hypothetical protein